MKLRIRLSVIVISILVAVVAVISVVLLNRASDMQIETALESEENLAGLEAADIQRRYEVYLGVARTSSQIMNGYADMEASTRRLFFYEALRQIFISNPRFVCMYTVWKPNVLDRDSLHIGEPGTSPSGQFIPLYSRESGNVTLRYCRDYETILSTVSEKEYMTDPEPRMVNGVQTYTFDIIVPIIPEGTSTVVGAVGIIVDIAYLQSIIEAIQPYEGSLAAAYTNDGTIIAHYVKDRVGQNIHEADAGLYSDYTGEVAAKIAAGESYRLREFSPVMKTYLWMTFHPIVIGEMEKPMAVMIGIPEREVLRQVTMMTIFTIVLSTIVMIVVSIIIFFVSSSIVKPIINVSMTLKDISEGEGDLTKTITYSSKDEIGDLALYFNQTLGKIRKLVLVIKQQAVALFDVGNELASNMTETAAAINEITANIQSVKGRVINQSASVTETNATMEQITANINKLNEHIEHQTESVTQSSSAIEEMLANIRSVTQTLVRNADNVKDLAAASEVGRSGIQGVAADIQEIARESEGLLEINAVMENIASQTNLLSMNAAIEA
ncbi:MAG: methyl-accepting chemotaxis protein, partial [Treponema sp.]|nr:methyl-accepting chemotaxis protein [Treponema sp.]